MAATTHSRSSICLVVCYFGTLPAYFDCVLRSCGANADIDWLILTDAAKPPHLPSNVHWHPATLAGLAGEFSKKIGFEVNLSHSRLLCDFKAAYGYFFEDRLRKYDFWGHCDLDMIFGDLRKFLREDILQAYPKILCRGHMTLYRNTPEVNRYFQLEAPGVINYRQAFQGGQINQFAFDEWRGIYLIFRYHGIPQFHDEFIVDLIKPTNWRITRFTGLGIKNYFRQVFYWHQGRIYHAHHNIDGGILDDEYAYLHFQKRALPPPSFDARAAPGFLITPDGFFPYNREPLTGADFARHNRARWRPRAEIVRHLRHVIGKRLPGGK